MPLSPKCTWLLTDLEQLSWAPQFQPLSSHCPALGGEKPVGGKKEPYKKIREHFEGTPVWQEGVGSVQTACLPTSTPLRSTEPLIDARDLGLGKPPGRDCSLHRCTQASRRPPTCAARA